MKAIIKIVPCILLCVLLICACGKTEKNPSVSSDGAYETSSQISDALNSEDAATNGGTVMEEDPFTKVVTNPDNGVIETPYFKFYFDDAFSDYLSVVHRLGDPYVLEFYTVLDNKPAQRLFDIHFGAEDKENIDMIDSTHCEVPVGTIFYPFAPDDSWTQAEIDTVLAMQEVLNQLIEQLMGYQYEADREDLQPSNDTTESNITRSIEIITPFCILHYPDEWEDYLQVEHIETEVYTLRIGAALEGKSPVLLFSLIFGGDDGNQLGAVKNSRGEYITVNLIMETLGDINYSYEDMTILYEMQEAVNALVEQLPLE